MGKSEKRQRTNLVAVRLLPLERELLKVAASREGVSLSGYLQRSAIREAQRLTPPWSAPEAEEVA